MNRREFKWVIDVLGMGLDQVQVDALIHCIKGGRDIEVLTVLRGHIAEDRISEVYACLIQLCHSIDISLMEVTRGQWMSLDINASYIARRGNEIAALRRIGDGWSLDGCHQIWLVVDR